MGTIQDNTFSGRLEIGTRPALVIIDVVDAYLDEMSPFYTPMAAHALAVTVQLVKTAHSLKLPIIFTNVVYHETGLDGGIFFKKIPALKVFKAGSPFGKFPAALQPQDSEIVVSKQYASAFFGTSLASTLRAMTVDTVFITGYSTSGCVRATAVDALQNGFIPFVVADGCADRNDTIHDANLNDLAAKYAEVVSASVALSLLRGIA